MSLRGTLTHRKTRRVAKILNVDLCRALGIIEAMIHVAAECAIAGDIGKMTNQDIAEEMFYQDDADEMINALIEAGYLEGHNVYRLVMHDWHQHADDAIQYKVHRAGLLFWNGHPSKRTAKPEHHAMPPSPDKTNVPKPRRLQTVRGEGGKFNGSQTSHMTESDGTRQSPPVGLRLAGTFENNGDSGFEPADARKRPDATVANWPNRMEPNGTEQNLTESTVGARAPTHQRPAHRPTLQPPVPQPAPAPDEAAYGAFVLSLESWCVSPPTAGGIGKPFYLSQMDQQILNEFYDELTPPNSPAMPRGNTVIGRQLLVGEVVAHLMAFKRPYKGLKYALATVRSTLDEWAARGAPAERSGVAERPMTYSEMDRAEASAAADRVAARLRKARETA